MATCLHLACQHDCFCNQSTEDRHAKMQKLKPFARKTRSASESKDLALHVIDLSQPI